MSSAAARTHKAPPHLSTAYRLLTLSHPTLPFEQDVFEEERLSEARLQATRNIAHISEEMARAEGVAAPYVEAKKQFETRQKQMKVWSEIEISRRARTL